MRVTHKQAADTIINNLRTQNRQILKTQNMISSGKKINRPSDDPIGMRQILDYRQILSAVDQYQQNIIQGNIRINTLETTLSAVDDLVSRARSIASDANYNAEMLDALADEVGRLREQIIQLANTRLGDVYIFAGHNTAAAPFLGDGTYTGDNGAYRIRVSSQSDVSLQIDGNTVFKTPEDLFAVLDSLSTALASGDQVQIQSQIDPLTRFQDHLRAVRANIAAGQNQLETSKNYLDNYRMNIESVLSDIENADLTEAIMELQFQNTVYEAALAAASDLLQPSLLQFLR